MRGSVAALVGLLAVLAACDMGDPAGPRTSAPAPLVAIGSAPLRRLSNVEYRNALSDLFPGIPTPALPELPPDIPVAGFENAAEAQRASDVLVARYETIAGLYAAAAVKDPAHLRTIVGCDDWSSTARSAACAKSFLETTGRKIFRRPLAPDERTRLGERLDGWRAELDFEGAVELTLAAMLQSPQFLYRVEPSPAGARVGNIVPVAPYAMASRLSFFLWESIPDDALLDAATKGGLESEEDVAETVLWMLADVRAERVFWDFPRQWLGLDRIALPEHAVRATIVDPQWSLKTQASANEEMQRFVRGVLAGGGTFQDLMTSRRAWVDGEMARVYGVPPPEDWSVWKETSLPEAERAGILTRASFLAGYAHAGATSPPVRGNAIELRFLCRLPISPPPFADLSQPMAKPGEGPKTNRMLFEERTSPPACRQCHAALNGFGFGLEAYDAAGRHRTSENGLPIDASGTISGTDVDGPFTGGVELSRALARSKSVHDCATDELVRYALGRAPVPGEQPAIAEMARAFLATGGDLRRLLAAIATSPSFRLQRVEAP